MKNIKCRRFSSLVGIVLIGSLLEKPTALADESGLPPASASSQYEPPKTPELYDKNPNGAGQPVNFGSHYYAAPSLVFGQSQSQESGAAASVGYAFQVDAGRRAYLRSTRLVDASFALFSGKLSDTLSDIDGLIGFMARIGYGYQIGQDMWGILKLGSGLVFGDYTGTTDQGYEVSTNESASGSLVQFAFYLANKPSEGFGFLGGVRHSLYNFDLGQVELKENGNVIEKSAKGLVVSATEIEVGIQMVF